MNAPTQDLATPAGATYPRVEGMIRSTQQAAHQTVDRFADGAERLAANADLLARRGAEALRDQVDPLRDQARRTVNGTLVQIREEPLKAVLIAGAIGAALGVLFTRLGRP